MTVTDVAWVKSEPCERGNWYALALEFRLDGKWRRHAMRFRLPEKEEDARYALLRWAKDKCGVEIE